jgi:2,3-bisphosphoglycerate-independent phosphoglycerate mutase
MNNSEFRGPLALIILDGWGVSADESGSAIAKAHTPYYDEICRNYPSTTLIASGPDVGLAEGAPGNAEIGHVNIGAGRVVQTDAARIADSVGSGEMAENEVLSAAFAKAATSGSNVHFVGMLSDSGVHSSMDTLYEMLRIAKRHRIANAFIHPILDGREVPARTGDIYVEALEIKLSDIGLGKIATVCGRFFAMDNEGNWERTARAFTMLAHSEGERARDAASAVRGSFLRGISDEFLSPIVIENAEGEPIGQVRAGDLIVFFNHRSDTMRQLVRSLAVPEPGSQSLSTKPRVDVVCLTSYDPNFVLPVAFPPLVISDGLGDVMNGSNIHNYRISEADRFAHVTQYLNNKTESSDPNELHIQVPAAARRSDREAEPEMRSFKIADSFMRWVERDPSGVFIINIPAPGLLAETGNFERTAEAVSYVDTCLGGMIATVRDHSGVAIITSTHGNCESMLNAAGEPDRDPTRNAVPFHLMEMSQRPVRLREGGSLRDIAPTILGVLGVEKPGSMTGSDLRIM